MQTTSSIWWVRHGPTNAKSMVGWSDLPADLSDTDRIKRLSAALPATAPIASSDLIRTVSTADAISEGRVRLGEFPTLREMNFGAWELKTHTEIEAAEPERIRAFWEYPGEVRPPGGESWNDLGRRVAPMADTLASAHGELIVVAHFGVILSEVQRALGWDSDRTFAQRIDPLSVTRITYGADRSAPVINHCP